MTDASRDPPALERSPLALGPWLWSALAVGLALRVWEAVESSLWLDELHTLSHASRPDLAAVAEAVRLEVHTPLFFQFVHLFGSWEQGAWLRAIPVLSSLVVLIPLIAFGRSLSSGGRGLALAVWLYACIPYQVHYATELRPYAWVGLFSALAVWLAFSERGPKKLRFVLFFLCVLLGLYTHRIMALTVLSIGAARLFVRGPKLLGLGWLILAGALAVLPFVAWLLSFAVDRTEERLRYHDEVGGVPVRSQLVKEVLALPLRVFVPYLGALGGAWAWLSRLGVAVCFGTSGLAALAWLYGRWRGGIERLQPRLRGLLLYSLTFFALTTACAIYAWDRVPLQYYVPIAWCLPLFLGEVVATLPTRVRKGATVLVAVGALALGVAQAGGRNAEDMRAAVAAAREVGAELVAAGEQPYYTALLSQPVSFEHRLPYLAYGRDLSALEPRELPRPGESGFERPVVCLRRGQIGLDYEYFADIVTGRRVDLERQIDPYLTLFVFRPAGEDE